MEPHGINLPDFSKGERFPDVDHVSFEPLFAGDVQGEDPASMQVDVGEDGASEPSSAMAGFDILDEELVTSDGEQEKNSISASEHKLIVDDLAKHRADLIDELTQKHQQEVLRYLEDLRSQISDIVSSHVEAELAAALSSLFESKLSATSIERLMLEFRAVAQNSVIDRVKISGPPEMVSAAFAELSDTSFPIEIDETDGVDLTVSFNDRSISTSIGNWMKLLEEAIAS